MKIQKAILFFLFIALTISCGDNFDEGSNQLSTFNEIQLNSSNAKIDGAIDGIRFQYYLINEQGKPATKFKVGENFSFFFSLTNNRKEERILCMDNNFLIYDNGFCKVISENGDTIGSPFELETVLTLGSGSLPFYNENRKYELAIPWVDNRERWYSLNCTLKNTAQTLLPKGKYYTEFTELFRFKRTVDEPSLDIGPVTFKINFKIE